MKILILKPSSLGDVIQALPVLRLLKRQLPASEIYWWIADSLGDLLREDADLAGLFSFHRDGGLRKAVPVIRAMRQQHFDLVLDLQSLARSAAIAWLAKGDLVVGLADPREGAALFHDVSVPRPRAEAHAVDWYLEVVRRLGLKVDWDLEWLPRRENVMAEMRQRWPVDRHRWIALQPGARWANKRWPVSSFQTLIKRMTAADPDLRFVVLGSAKERELGAALSAMETERVLDLTGHLTLPMMVEWLRASSLLITNDTGPMHAAVAVGIPVVALFGPTSRHRTGPYGQADAVLQLNLPCVPCLKSNCSALVWQQCLAELPVEKVVLAALDRLRSPWIKPYWVR